MEKESKKTSHARVMKQMRESVGFQRYEKYLKKLYNIVQYEFSVAKDNIDLVRLASRKVLLEEIAQWLKVEIQQGEPTEEQLQEEKNLEDEY